MLESLRAKEEGLWIRVYMDDYGIIYEGTEDSCVRTIIFSISSQS